MAKKVVTVKNMKELTDARKEMVRQAQIWHEDGIIIHYAKGFKGEPKNKPKDPCEGCPKHLLTKEEPKKPTAQQKFNNNNGRLTVLEIAQANAVALGA